MRRTERIQGIRAAVRGGIALLVLAAACRAPVALAASPSGSPDAERPAVVDDAVAFTSDEKARLGDQVASLLRGHDVEAVVASRLAADPGSESEADAAAAALMDRLGVGVGHGGGLVVLFDLDGTRCHGQARLFASAALRAQLPDADRQAIFEQAMLPSLRDCRLADAAAAGLERTDRFLSGDRTLPGSDDDAAAFLAVVLLLGVALLVMAALWVAVRVAWGRIRALPGARSAYRSRLRDGGSGEAVPGFWAWWLGIGVADRDGTGTDAGHPDPGFGGGGGWTDAPASARGFGGGGFWAGLREDAGRAVRLGGASGGGGSGSDAGQGGSGSWSDAGSSGASSGGGGAGGAF